MKILIIRVSAIGDVIHTFPSIFLLKKTMPNAQISWVVQKKAADLVRNQPFLDNVWELPDKYLKPEHWAATYTVIKKMRAHHWDAIIDFQGLLKTSLLLCFLKGKKYGFDKNNARWPASTWFTGHHTTPTFTNIIQKNLALASDVAWDLANTPTVPLPAALIDKSAFTLTPEQKLTVDAWIASQLTKPFIAFCPNTTWESKKWPRDYWIDLLKSCHQTLPNLTIVIVGTQFGPDAAWLAQAAHDHNIPIIPMPKWPLLPIGYALSFAQLVVAPDTGLLHINDLFGTPALGIFGPTNKHKHGPFLTPGNVANALQIQCPHIYQKVHGPTEQENCMRSFTPAMMLERIQHLIPIQ
jgi:lipopolysaccharide heptosyltransferase I